ncbi:MAG: 50S ribosomal protein L6 [Candidatus Aenigmarchaeota archaeon]|nr:50S ribosomal protein L6 [Candidatus Aenigmarchaeota archaeon]
MEKIVQIPDKVTVTQQGAVLVVKGPKGELRRELRHPQVQIQVEGSQVKVSCSSSRRKMLAMTGTFAAHVRNMTLGVTKGYQARMKVVYSHFPIKVKVEGQKVAVQNFLGERDSRTVDVGQQVKVQATKDEVIITGTDKEAVGQAAGMIERITKVTGFDRRVFQDGIHLTHQASEAA